MMVLFHVDAQAVKGDAFSLESHPLLEACFTTQQDFSAGAHHALPRHPA